MNIRPIDLQVLIPHTTEVSRAQALNNQQGALQQDQFAAQFQKIAADRQQQVQNTAQSAEENKIRRDHERKHEQNDGNSDKRRRHGQQKSDTEGSQKSVSSSGHIIDITT